MPGFIFGEREITSAAATEGRATGLALRNAIQPRIAASLNPGKHAESRFCLKVELGDHEVRIVVESYEPTQQKRTGTVDQLC